MIAIASGSLGFGASQMKLATEVYVDSNRITHLELADKALEERIAKEGTRTDARIFEMRQLISSCMALQQEQVKQATELIALIKVQNQLLKTP